MNFAHKLGKDRVRSPRRLLQIGLIVLLAVLVPPSSWAQSTILRIIVLHGYPGHTGVHLTRGSDQQYWDPGGNYGQEQEECLQTHAEKYCRQWYAGFSWDDIKAARRHDVFSGRAARLMQVLAVEVLDYEGPVDVFTYRLEGEPARRAWQILHEGATKGAAAAFATRHAPMFCTRAVSSYLREIGGPFSGLSLYWRPTRLAEVLHKRTNVSRETYTLRTPTIQRYINTARKQTGHGPLPMELAVTAPDGRDTLSP